MSKAVGIYGLALVLGVAGGMAPLMKGPGPSHASLLASLSPEKVEAAALAAPPVPVSVSLPWAAPVAVGAAELIPRAGGYDAVVPIGGLSDIAFAFWARVWGKPAGAPDSAYAVDGMVYPPVSQGRTTLALEGLEQGREYVVDLFANLAVSGPSATGSVPQRVGVLFVAWPSGGTERVYGYYAPGDPVMRIGLRGGKADTRWTVRLSSGNDSEDYTATGSDTEVDVDLSGGRWTGQVSVHMYHADGPGGLERPLLGTEIAAGSGAGFTGSPEDDADGPNDAFDVAEGTAGASSVNLILNGQSVTPTTLPSFLNGQNPFSYSLVKGKPNGTTKKTVYSFKTSTNSFSLATCNAAVPKKPLNWSIQVDPNSVPQNLVMMSTPQVTGGQTCSAGSIGSCKKPTQFCFYGDAYTSPSTIALTSSAPSWTVNMCLRWGFPSLILSEVYANGQPGAWLYNLPAGGALTATASFSKTLSLTQTSMVLNTATTAPPVLFNPGPFNLKYNGASGTISGVTGSWSIAGMQIIDWDNNVVGQCLGQSCVTSGLSYNYQCVDQSHSPFMGGVNPTFFAVYFYNTAGARPAHLPTIAPNRTTQPQY